jgi:MFS transporter, SP family, sugar:H+ symporter
MALGDPANNDSAFLKKAEHCFELSPRLLLRAIISNHGYRSQETRKCRGLCGACHPHWHLRQLWRSPLRVCFSLLGVPLRCHLSFAPLRIRRLTLTCRYDTGTIGGILAMKYWRQLFSTGYRNPVDDFPDVDANQTSEIVSILSAGTFFGALLAAPTADYMGRRWAMIFQAGVVFNLGVILQTAATDIPIFVAGRFFAGLGVGLLSATIPLYQSETAPKWIRGAIVGCYQWAITIGLLLAAVVLNATKNRNDTGSYRIPIAVQFAWSIVLVVGMLILPETPRYLIKKNKHDMAAKSLSRLRRLDVDHPALLEELSEIQANHEYEMSLGKANYLECFKPPLLKRLLTGCGLQGLQQLTGVNFIFYYGTSFFSNSGIDNPFVISMITSVVNVLSTVPGLYLVEKWGRRPLLMFG